MTIDPAELRREAALCRQAAAAEIRIAVKRQHAAKAFALAQAAEAAERAEAEEAAAGVLRVARALVGTHRRNALPLARNVIRHFEASGNSVGAERWRRVADTIARTMAGTITAAALGGEPLDL